MASYALLIGIDTYLPKSGTDPQASATAELRRLAAWLTAQGGLAPERVRLLCAPHDPQRGERPATRAGILDALREVRQAGDDARPGDRLYLCYAGYGAGYFNEQLMLLPQEPRQDTDAAEGLPWIEVLAWLRSTGFDTQICFLDIQPASTPNLADALARARLRLDSPIDGMPSATPSQHLFYASAREPAANAGADSGLFLRLLRRGLGGAAGVSVDQASGQRVVLFSALRAYLEDAVGEESQGRQRCVVTAAPHDDPVMAQLGPAPLGTVRVIVVPPEASLGATVQVFGGSDQELLITSRSSPPLDLDLLQGDLYGIKATAAGWEESWRYISLQEPLQTVTIRLRPDGAGTLAGRRHGLAELRIQPADPYLPVQLYDGRNKLLSLPPLKARGIVRLVPPDIYRADLIAPRQTVRRTFTVSAEQEALTIDLPLEAPGAPLDRLLAALEAGPGLVARVSAGQAALVVLAATTTVTCASIGQGSFQPTTLQRVPESLANQVRSYSGDPGIAQMQFHTVDGQAYQLLVPLLAGRTTIVGLDDSDVGLPSIEMLLAPMTLLRRHSAAQRRILWAQRFFSAERHMFVPRIVQHLDDEPLALMLGGYSALNMGDRETARIAALRLRIVAPSLADGALLIAATERVYERPSNGNPIAGIPVLLAGLPHQIRLAASREASLWLMERVVLNQTWLLLRGHETPAPAFEEQIDKAALHEAMIRAFNIDELNTLCFDIQARLEADDIPLQVDLELIGKGSKPALVLGLIHYLERRGYLSYLVDAVRRARPGLL